MQHTNIKLVPPCPEILRSKKKDINPASVWGNRLDDLLRFLPVLHFYDSKTGITGESRLGNKNSSDFTEDIINKIMWVL